MRNGTDSARLIEHALRRLLPDVFFHPIWTRFVEACEILSREQVQSLLCTADRLLSDGKLDDASETLFVCAFQQLRAGDDDAALGSIQQVLDLAERHELLHAAACGAWAAAAVCARRGWYPRAAEHLAHLHFILCQQHDWVLSDVIDVIWQALLSKPEVTAIDQLLSSDANLSCAFGQMLYWGTPAAASETGGSDWHDGNGKHDDSAISSPRSIGFSWHLLWQAIKRIAKGELRLKWVETNRPASLARLEESKALILDSPSTIAELVPAPVPASLNPSATSVREQEPVTIQPLAPDQSRPAAELSVPLSITAHLLGTFSFSVNDTTVQSWPTGKGRAVFKYMLAHHDQPIPRDVLMDVFWPQAGPGAARNCLNAALHGLRQVLKTVTDRPVVLFEEGAYCISPEFQIWTDMDEFDRHIQVGRRYEAMDQLAHTIVEYEAAVELYKGDFLAGDLYEEWPVLVRERLRVTYLDTLDRLSRFYFSRHQYTACEATCQQILARDNCREDAHCLLMRCYSRQEQENLALRQYQSCVEALRSELDVGPASATAQLYERIRRREPV